MKLKIENGLLYVDNQRFCFAEVEGMDGNLPTGPRAVVTQYSADHGDILPRVADYGWIGARTGRRIVIGRVRSRYGNPVGATPAAWNAIFLAAAALDPLTV